MNRGDAATWICRMGRGDAAATDVDIPYGSRRRRGCRRGYSAEASRGDAAAATWIFRGGAARRRRGCRHGYSVEASRGDAARLFGRRSPTRASGTAASATRRGASAIWGASRAARRSCTSRRGRTTRSGHAARNSRDIFLRPSKRGRLRLISTDYPRLRLISTDYSRLRLISTDYPRRGRGVAATRLDGISAPRPRRRRDSSEEAPTATIPSPGTRTASASSAR